MSVEKYEAEIIKPKLANKRGTAVSLPNGGFAYVREPTEAEFVGLQAISDAPHDAYVPAFANYVKACYLGACDSAGAEISFDDVKRVAGVGFVSTGPLGAAVNKLAGTRTAQTRDL